MFELMQNDSSNQSIMTIFLQFNYILFLASPPVARAALIPKGSVPEGSTANLDCSASVGIPPITYTWTSPNGVVVASQSIFQLRPTRALDYGVYTCTAANVYGTNNATVQVMYPGKPGRAPAFLRL